MRFLGGKKKKIKKNEAEHFTRLPDRYNPNLHCVLKCCNAPERGMRMHQMGMIQLCLRHQRGKQSKLCAAGDKVIRRMS